VKAARIKALAVLILGSSLAPYVVQSHAGSTHGAPLRETVTVAADEPIPNLPGKRLVSHIVDYPLGRARRRTVTPARPSSTPMSSRARFGARSMASLPASTGPVRRGSRGPAPIIG
jgi:hypothetical protein